MSDTTLTDELQRQLDEAHQTIVTLTEANEALRAQLAERDAKVSIVMAPQTEPLVVYLPANQWRRQCR